VKSQYFESDYTHLSLVKRTHTHAYELGQVICYLLEIALLTIMLSKRGNYKMKQILKVHNLLNLCLLICVSSGLFSSQADVNCEVIVC
jgi:hypothetical protein